MQSPFDMKSSTSPTTDKLKIKNSISFTALSLFFFLFSPYSTWAAEPTKQAASLVKLEMQLKKTPQNISVRQNLAKQYLVTNQSQKTIDLLAAYSNELNSEGLITLAEAYGLKEENLEQIRVLQLLTEKDSRRFRPRYLLGLALKKNKNYDEAAKQLRKSIELAPQHRPSYEALLEIFTETKQNYESRTLLGEMIKTFGQKKEFVNQQCRLLAEGNFLNEAIDICKAAISQNPSHPDNHIYLAQTYYNQGNKNAADRIFTTAGRQFSKSEFVQYATGEYYLSDKNNQAAIRYLKNAVTLNPKSLRAQFTLGRAYFETRAYTEALTHFSNACDLDKSKETYNELRTCLFKLREKGLHKEASDYERKAATCQK